MYKQVHSVHKCSNLNHHKILHHGYCIICHADCTFRWILNLLYFLMSYIQYLDYSHYNITIELVFLTYLNEYVS